MIPVLAERLPAGPVFYQLVQLGFGALFKMYLDRFPSSLSLEVAHILHCDQTLVYMRNVKCYFTVKIMNVTLLVLVDFYVDLTFYSYKLNCFSSGSLTHLIKNG